MLPPHVFRHGFSSMHHETLRSCHLQIVKVFCQGFLELLDYSSHFLISVEDFTSLIVVCVIALNISKDATTSDNQKVIFVAKSVFSGWVNIDRVFIKCKMTFGYGNKVAGCVGRIPTQCKRLRRRYESMIIRRRFAIEEIFIIAAFSRGCMYFSFTNVV